MKPFIIVSSDGHVSPPMQACAQYLERRFQHNMFDLARENDEWIEWFGERGRYTPEEFELIDTRGRLATGGEFGTWDAERRLEELDAEGVAAELLLFGTQFGQPPFFSVVNQPNPPELRAAGARAYNRWLAEMMIDRSGGRLLGVAEPGPCLDLKETLDGLRWAAEHGFVSVTVPGTPHDPDLPSLLDDYFEPFWAECEMLNLVLSVHAGWGAPQGRVQELMGSARSSLGEMHISDAQKIILKLDMGPRSVFWKLILAGVFDRHPTLKLALTEIRADWVPATLAHLDERISNSEIRLKMKPSEYFAQNCVVIPSSIHRSEVELRHEIGLHQMLFGLDFPHFESSWPNTLEWLQSALHDVPEDEARMFLGENAITCFGLDRRRLTAIAEKLVHSLRKSLAEMA